ncbi:MAG: hypothetical protein NTZ56_11370 [Acidobacteria bacterium]|nr:hypothetical protein [Acidobacteriota bacterium]
MRINLVAPDSLAAAAGLRVGDILVENDVLSKIRRAPADGADVKVLRLNEASGQYQPASVRVKPVSGQPVRLGIMYDLGFAVRSVEAGSLAARARIQASDFLPKIDETFVHDVETLDLISSAAANGRDVTVNIIRWLIAEKRFDQLKAGL